MEVDWMEMSARWALLILVWMTVAVCGFALLCGAYMAWCEWRGR